MKVIDLGTCCIDCFNAVNFSLKELSPEQMESAAIAGKALSALVDGEGVQSIHTGEDAGFSHSACTGCGNELAGERYELYGLQAQKDIA